MLGLAWFLYLTGALLLAHSALPLELKLIAVAAWLGGSYYETMRYGRSGAGLHRIRLHADRRIDADVCGVRHRGKLLAGSRITAGHAWLRIRLDDGPRIDLWLSRSDSDPRQWRRLLTLWRYGNASE